MCDPVSLTIAATAVGVAGSAYTGVAANNDARYAAQVATNNAALARGEAADALDRGNREEMRKWREVAQTKSAQIAGMAANGLDTSFGSAVDVVTDTAVYGAMDAQTIQEGAAREATGFLMSAQNYGEEAKAQRRQGRNALIGAGFEAAGTILSGASQIKGMQRPTSKISGYGRSNWSGSASPNSAFKW